MFARVLSPLIQHSSQRAVESQYLQELSIPQGSYFRINTFGFLSGLKLQASETLRNSTHSSTAADLLQAKQQILTHQQQLEAQDHLLEDYQKKKEDFKNQISFLQEKIKSYEMVCLF